MRLWLLNCLAVVFLLACSGEGAVVEQDSAPDTRTADATSDTAKADLPTVFPELVLADLELWDHLDDAQADTGLGPDPGEAGYPCTNDAECSSDFCIQTADGKVCTSECIDECPFGWQCSLHKPALPDQIFICAPPFMNLCKPCNNHDDCATNGVDLGDLCLDLGPAGSFCGGDCSGNQGCPGGYECVETTGLDGAPANQCAPSGECQCAAWYVAEGAFTSCFAANEWGTCSGERSCEQDGLSPCSAPVPEAEVCDGQDNDCDDDIDEGTGGASCLLDNEFGECPGVQACQEGGLECAGNEAEAEACDGMDNDCDGGTDEGFPDTDDDGTADCMETDVDGDGIADVEDNCKYAPNPGQKDFDFDGDGDECDLDDDNDLVPDDDDCGPYDAEIHPGAEEVCDGLDNDCDLVADEGFPDSDVDGLKDCLDDDDDNDGVADGLDCAATDPTVFPDAPELCDGKDNDCDGQADEDFPDEDEDGEADCLDDDMDGDDIPNGEDNCLSTPNPEQKDADGDGLGNACDPDLDGDGIGNGPDNCPDLFNPLQTDTDGDGAGDACDEDADGDGIPNVDDNCFLAPNPLQEDLDEDGAGNACDDDDDGDGDPDNQDCAPLDPAIFHGADEVCDGLDNDCQDGTDNGFPDFDLDGLKDCVDPDDDNDQDPDATDCAPTDPLVNHDAVETCDGTDNDCDGKVDEETGTLACGKGSCFHTIAACIDGVVQICDPLQGAAMEICDGLDNDCDGIVDEDLGWLPCGTGPCLHLMYSCKDGVAAECDPFVGAEPEECDGLDNDCDGFVDDGLGQIECGLGNCHHVVDACAEGELGKCDPFFGAELEKCDGQDNDCNGHVDEELGSVTCGLGPCEHTVANCQDGKQQVCDPFEGKQQEICDGEDNDCDNEVDEGFDVDLDGVSTCAGDCNDLDINNWNSCESCEDADEDGWWVDCDTYSTIDGPDCSDDDPDNWISCETCLDVDEDGAPVGCDKYSKFGQADCSDDDPDNWLSCDTCLDNDEDGQFAGCDLYALIPGPDCADDDPNNWAQCDSCVDVDQDTYYIGCDAYETIDGGDCDDTKPEYNPGADEGCDGNDYNCDDKMDNDGDEDGFPSVDCGGTDCADNDPDIKPGDGGCALGKSCREILDKDLATDSGTYLIDPDGWNQGADPFEVHCEMELEDGGWTRIAANKCFGAKGSQYATFSTNFTGSIDHYLAVRMSGCLGNGGGNCGATGIWGSSSTPPDECPGEQQNGFYMVTSGNQPIITDATVDLFSNVSYSHSAWILMADFCASSPHLRFDYVAPHDFVAGSYQLWFGEDYRNYTESDNAGTVCADVYAR